MNRPCRLIARTLLLTAALAGSAFGQEVLLYRAGETPDARDVARILGRQQAAAPQEDERDMTAPLTRGFKLAAPATRPERIARPVVSHAGRPGAVAARSEGTEPTALALGIQFAFDSAEILPPARAQLDALAEGIKLLAPGQRVQIEGHTDATGSDDYNQALSLRRASSVRQYLMDAHGIDGARLDAVGFGETRPLDRRDPFAVENRRVQFQGG